MDGRTWSIVQYVLCVRILRLEVRLELPTYLLLWLLEYFLGGWTGDGFGGDSTPIGDRGDLHTYRTLSLPCSLLCEKTSVTSTANSNRMQYVFRFL